MANICRIAAYSVVFVLGSSCAQSTPNLFQCQILQSGQLDENGYINDSQWTKNIREAVKDFVFDSRSEQLFWGGRAYDFKILQHPTPKSSLVAFRHYQGPASIVVENLRIETWREGSPFIYYDANEIYSGKCRSM